MAQQLDRVIYRAPARVRTLNQATQYLYGIPHPIVRYRQIVDGDSDWQDGVSWNPDQGVMTVRLPAGVYGWVTGVRNTGGARMVTYVTDVETGMIQEVEVRERTEIGAMEGRPELRIYTRRPVGVSMDVYLVKRSVRSRM
jgi:hypothetical protein